MSKGNINKIESSGGQLKYNRIFELNITDQGQTIDFSGYDFEDGGNPSHIQIINDGGSNDVYFAFDVDASTIDTDVQSSYNGKCYSGSPYNDIGLDGTAESIALKCESGLTTTVKLLVW